MRRHGDAVLGRLTLVDGDDLECRRSDVEVCEAGVLQVVEVALGQSVPGVNSVQLNMKSPKRQDLTCLIMYE